MRMVRNIFLLAGFSGLLVAQRFMPREYFGEMPALPRISAEGVEDVTQWPTRVYAPFALPRVKRALYKMKIEAEPLPVDPLFFVESAADEACSPKVSGLLEPIEKIRPLICSGSGSFHHLSYVICHEWIDAMQIPYTVVMFDAHDDAAKPDPRMPAELHCGMWGHYTMETSPFLKRFLGVGIVNNYFIPDLYTWISDQAYVEGKMDLYPPRPDHFFFGHAFNPDTADFRSIQRDLVRPLLGAEGYHCRMRSLADEGFDLLRRIPTEHVYISVDMDVLHEDDFSAVEWGNGDMKVQEVLDLIDRIAEHRTLLGADICGYPQYQREIELTEEEDQLSLKAYRALYDRLATHLNLTEPPR